MTDVEEPSHLFDEKLRKYEAKLVDIMLDLGQTKRTNPKMSAIACYLLIHGKLTQKELKKLTGFSMGTISTYLSVMLGTGNFQKMRIPRTHTFIYSFSGELEVLTTKAIEFAISNLGSIEIYLKSKMEALKKLNEKNMKGAKHLLERVKELIESFKLYKLIFPSRGISVEEIQKQIPSKSFKRYKKEEEIVFDQEVYLIEDDIINQLITSPMFSMRDPMFIRILGLFMTRKCLTQTTLKRITSLSSGKLSEEVNQLLENGIIYKAHISEKGKITYCADSFIILRFSRHILSRMTKLVKELEDVKLQLEKNKSKLKNLAGFSQIYRICEYTLNAISQYSEYKENIDILLGVY